MRLRPFVLAALMLVSLMLLPLAADAQTRRRRRFVPSGKLVFSGWVRSANEDRTRLRVRSHDGEHVVRVQGKLVWKRGTLVSRRQVEPGMRLLVTARQIRRGTWIASRVEIM